MNEEKKKRISLKLKVTILSGTIILITAILLTLFSIRNAKTTYGNQFSLQIGDDVAFSYNDHDVVIDGENDINDVLSFIGNLGGSDKESSRTILSKANQAFTEDSVLSMVIISVIGILITYFVVSKALKPVKELDDSMKAINESNLCKPVSIRATSKEIEGLSESFNTMLTRLDESFQMQRNFANNAAHELKTPLATMKAGLQVLQMEENPSMEDYRENVGVMEHSTERLIHIVEDLLSLTREEGGSYQDIIDIREVVNIILDELYLTANERKVTLQVGSCNGQMRGNQVLIYRALFNLIENAIKYNREGGNVTILCGPNENRNLLITIADNGIGMLQDDITHIFEPFYRADKSRSRAMGGSGLGLAIVKRIVEKHNGRIQVQSNENIGTVFYIEFYPIYG
jgi:signal transduction histidine kinase